ncbi:MAG: ABC transporter substrate-binding protein [Candidatus Limnocylindria bacterium]
MRPRRFVPLVVLAVALTACAPAASPSPSVILRPVTLLLGFQPDVQFAPFYYAQQEGYYAKYGLDVTIEYKGDADLVRLVADGQAQFGVTDATDVMISRTAGIPIKYVATLYRLFPVALIGPKGTVPTDPAQLAGKRIGTPGKYGSSWHALRALLQAGGLAEADVTIREYPQFNQVQGLLNGDVELITGFRNNEPLRLKAQGMETDLLAVERTAPLPGPGLIVGDELLAADPELVQKFVNGTFEAMAPIAAEPQLGVDAAIVAVPTIASDKATALAVLTATVKLWTLADGGVSPQIDRVIWASGYDTMKRLGFIDGSVPLDAMITEEIVPSL